MESQTTDPVEQDQYRKIHNLADKVEQLTGVVKASNDINLQLVELMKKALMYMFWIIVLLIGTVIYGAIGKEGFYAVRHSVANSTYSVDPYIGDRKDFIINIRKENKP